MKMIPIGFVVRIAEPGTRHTGPEAQGEVDHHRGVAGIERSNDECLVGREDGGVYADAEREGKDRHGGEPGIAAQGARAVTQVLENCFEQDHLLAAPLWVCASPLLNEYGARAPRLQESAERAGSSTGLGDAAFRSIGLIHYNDCNIIEHEWNGRRGEARQGSARLDTSGSG